MITGMEVVGRGEVGEGATRKVSDEAEDEEGDRTMRMAVAGGVVALAPAIGSGTGAEIETRSGTGERGPLDHSVRRQCLARMG